METQQLLLKQLSLGLLHDEEVLVGFIDVEGREGTKLTSVFTVLSGALVLVGSVDSLLDLSLCLLLILFGDNLLKQEALELQQHRLDCVG